MIWKPHVTVAAVIERDQRFLLVEEHTPDGIKFNQPAGHLDEHEDLITAACREVKEETAWNFEPEALLGVMLWRKSPDSITYLRFCFTGSCHSFDPNQQLDEGIIQTHWLTRAEVEHRLGQMRSPLVPKCIDLYLSGTRYPLTMLDALLEQANG